MTEGAQRFLDYLGQESTLRSTDDVLAATLPLFEQVLEAHERGQVAPLEGVDDLMVEDGRLWFERAKTREPRSAPTELARLTKPQSLAFDIGAHYKTVEDEDGNRERDLLIAEAGEALERPAYVTRYVCWEHEVGHHDPLSDIYVLGLVLASVALDRSLSGAAELRGFVHARAHLAAENSRLHPVVARAIARMTELDRHERAQDLRALIETLKSYREQTLTLSETFATPADGGANDARRRTYARLRDRLFDFSRRNRLLHFQASGQTVNLTLGSVPLVLDVKNVAPDALLTWSGRAAEDIASTKPVPLGRYLRFEDYPFLSSALDQLRLDANRSKTELGFSPLRLAVCFLHWHNLKEAPEQRITSPLLLLPVTLEKKKGVRDAVFLTAQSDHAEVNPVLRQYLHELYGVRLPEHVELAEPGALEAFGAELTRQVQASEPAVSITRVDKPRIDLILAQAKKRLEAYRKRVQLSGRAARSHRGFDYSYARSKFHPLGVQLFTHLVHPAPAPGRDIHDEPRPRIFQHSPDVVQKSLYSLKDGGTEGGPYEWALDTCSVTLANFNYRKMSLVRDYASLLESTARAPSFEALFSSEARPVRQKEPEIPLQERFDVMPADPTQLGAVARARSGECFIIQGPPGTGKSQTITNLIADYVARGKRVLFVCEKRAAIDVVSHRLHMQGLAPLTCLIHDSQADKKAFIKDLKQTYEDFIARAPAATEEDARRGVATAYASVIERAERFRRSMQLTAPGADEPILALLRRALELQDLPASGIPAERVPEARRLALAAPSARAVELGLRAVGRDQRFAHHPLRFLADEVLFAENPPQAVREEAKALLGVLAPLQASQLARVGEGVTAAELARRVGFLATVKPLVSENALRLLDTAGEARRAFDALLLDLSERANVAAKAAAAAAGWRKPVPADEVGTALTLARGFEGSLFARLFAWLSPSWWRLRGLLASSFDFASKALRPSFTEILEKLAEKYRTEAELSEARARGQQQFRLGDVEAIGRVLATLPSASAAQSEFRAWLTSPGGESDAPALVRLAESSSELEPRLKRLVRGPSEIGLAELTQIVSGLEASAADLPAILEPLRKLAAPEHAALSAVLREFPASVEQLERDASRQGAELGMREHALDMLTGLDWDALRDEAMQRGGELRRANAGAIVERARNAFLEHVRISNAPSDALGADQKKFKKAYAAGRKELEHEFGKTTRYRSIRDLSTGNAGVVVRDLKPVWLMSPLSVADTLPLEAEFDVVIFDEASQIPLEDAVPAAHRAPQTIVVGDEMQLPPTDFFGSAHRDTEDDEPTADGYELDAHSLLTHAARALPSTLLGWHYRSRDEALITFSNRVFYEGKLLTVPSVTRPSERGAIVAREAKDGALGASALLERSVSFHRVDNSPYEQRRNAGEARYIAELVRGLLGSCGGKTIGVVAFSEAQQAEIESALRDLGEDDPAFAARYETELEREEDGQHVGLFVKNLENVQGDERDIIVISVCYGPDAKGKMLMNFGPINKTGGEKRLNVIFSRAKHHLAVVSSIRWSAITNEYNDGANCLRNYLRYAEAISTGALSEAALALQGYGTRTANDVARNAGSLDERLASALREQGYEVDLGVGTSQFRCNLGVRVRGEQRYRVGILLDDDAQQHRAVDELLHAQAAVLRGFGWNTLTVLHKDWYADPALVVQRIQAALTAS